ncbi:MAG TPA: hypothetical protein VD794_12300, partial [Flavisolibacter sp.]|nr:hypothetical protein [Flavisolibacter sp.]
MPKLPSAFILTCLIIATALSCNQLKRKGEAVVETTKQTVAEKKADLGDKIIARSDAYEPDTRYNRKRFAEFFGFAPTADVKNLYCYADEMGIDHKYQFAFNCDTVTVNRITSQLQLKKQNKPDNFSSGLWHSFPWWDSATIETLAPYQKKGA